MQVTKVLSTSITAAALAFSMLASTIPAAAIPGDHAAYFSESSFLGLANGQTGQFAVGYSNTGDTAWTKGSATLQASLRTRNGDTTLSTAGWASSWVSPSIYANQANDLVAPGQVGFFIYNILVPASAPLGATTFSGIPWVGSQAVEDYGYYQVVTVTGSAIRITASTPASPSTTTTPTISGTGATATTIVTVQEGTTSLCTSTATATGTFSCTTSALSGGSHSITATAAGQGTSAVFSYSVDTGVPTIASVDTLGGLQRLNICYNKAMSGAGSGDIRTVSRYTLSPALTLTGGTNATTGTVSESVLSADSKCVVLVLGGVNQLVKDVAYTLSITGAADAAGNIITAGSTFPFTATDGSAPTASGITQPGTQSIVVTFSEPIYCTTLVVCTTATGAANFKWDSANFPGTIVAHNYSSNLNKLIRLSFTTAAASGTHTLDVLDVRDAANNLISPNPTSFTVTISDDTTRPTVTSATAARLDNGSTTGYTQTISVNFSEGMKAANGGWSAGTSVIDTVSNYTLSNPDGSSATTGCASGSGTAITAQGTGSLSNSLLARFQLSSVRLTFGNASSVALLASGCAYTLSVSNVQDQAGNAVSPNPALVTITDTADTAAFAALTASIGPNAAGTLSELTVCYNKTMLSSLAAATAPGQGNTTASTNSNYTSTGTSTFTLTGAGTGTTKDSKCVKIGTTTLLTAGTYQVTITGVTDPAGNTISPNPTAISITFSDSAAPTLSSSARSLSPNSFTVTFSEAMVGGSAPSNSAGNQSNYSIDNQAYGNLCGNGTPTISSNSAGTVWTILCTTSNNSAAYWAQSGYTQVLANAGTLQTTNSSTVTAKNVADTNGNVINPNPQSKPIV